MDLNAADQPRKSINLEKALNNLEEDSNNFLKVTPRKLEFTFSFTNLKTQEKIVEITNYFSKSCPIQISPLETHYFRIKNTSRRRLLNPGSIFKINILFVPDEARDYNEVLKIRYFDDQILSIKISAKLRTIFSFPTDIDFGNVPLGRAACHKIPIHSCPDKKFSFAILPSKEDPCIDVYPRWGQVKPGDEPSTVMIIYRPLRYISMNFQIRIFISDLCKTPYTVNFNAYTRPGLLRETLEVTNQEIKSSNRPRREETVTRKKVTAITSKRDTAEVHAKETVAECMSYEKALIKQLEHLPLNSLHAVNCILNSKIRRVHGEHELKGPLNIYLSQVIEKKLKKQKEFLIKAEEYRQENERAKIYHKPKVNHGTRDTDENEITEIKMRREQTWTDYKECTTTTLEEELFERQEVRKIRQRILRVSPKYPDVSSTDSTRGNEFLRHCKIAQFLQASRKIVSKNRLLKTLEKLKTLTPKIVAQFEVTFVENLMKE